jgi:hypothetical protein
MGFGSLAIQLDEFSRSFSQRKDMNGFGSRTADTHCANLPCPLSTKLPLGHCWRQSPWIHFNNVTHAHPDDACMLSYIYTHCILSVYLYIYIILHGPRATSSQIICQMNMQYSTCCQGISIISLHRCTNVACTCGNVWHYELNIGNIGQKL